MHQPSSAKYLPAYPAAQSVRLQEWGWNDSAELPKAAYVHIPFCRHRCGYCNFSLLANRDDLIDRFLAALERELEVLETPRPVETIFIGGGTPSILNGPQMNRLLSIVAKWLPLAVGGEWSIECNPLDIREEICEPMSTYGVNRISLGGQSFQPNKLKTLERDHSPTQLVQSIERVRQLFERISLDLIFAAPNETLSDWSQDLRMVRELGIRHVSTYGLTYEKGAKFWGLRNRKQLKPAEESLELEMYTLAIDYLTGIGLEHYEVSNFAVDGHRCRHNQAYWQGKPWWAFGPSAARFVGGVRSVNHRGTLEYMRRIESDRSAVVEHERLTEEQQVRERFVFGMRQMAGVVWSEVKAHATQELIESMLTAVQHHVQSGWMEWRDGRIRLARQGLLVSDSLWEAYL